MTDTDLCTLLRQLKPEYLCGVWFEPRKAADVIERLTHNLSITDDALEKESDRAATAEAALSERIAAHEVCLDIVRELRVKLERADAMYDAALAAKETK